MPFTLNSIVPWGRSYAEYLRMFSLTPADLAGAILGCADGPASFNAEATSRGGNVASCDPLYAHSADEIRERIEATHPEIMKQTRMNVEQFVWEDFTSPEELGRSRRQSMETFLEDYPSGLDGQRYIAGELPDLPFSDQAFELAVCSHFLFLYSSQLAEEFHIAAINELLRVAREVRMFPIISLEGRRSEHLPAVLEHFRRLKLTTTVERVSYEFVRGANEMLRIRR